MLMKASFLVDRITALNWFGCRISSSENSITRRAYQELGSLSNIESVSPYANGSTGIGIWTSSINHDCLPNAHCSFTGEIMIVRAASPISANTELILSYVPCNHEDVKRKNTM